MIVRVSQRGYSFKGAGEYFLHDKKAQTKERVDWSMSLNTVSNDSEKSLREMAWLSQNSEYIKQLYGGSNAGRKPSGKNVLPFSLSWHPEQNPDDEHMRQAALEALKIQGLDKHQAVLVAHNDTKYKHVHVIVNLVNPETGRVNTMSMGKRKFSEWAQEYEEQHGKIYCQQRLENNKLRKENERKPKEERHKISYKEKAILNREAIREAYDNCKDLSEFQEILKTHGYHLAEGRKGRMVLLDKDGHTSNLVRQLEGVKTKDVRSRFPGIENGMLEKAEVVIRNLEIAKEQSRGVQEKFNKDNLSDDRVFDRDKYETEWQKSVVDAGINADKSHRKKRKNIEEKRKSRLEDVPITSSYPNSFAEELDKKRKEELKQEQSFTHKVKELNEFYNREKHLSRIDELRMKIIISTSMKDRKELQEEYLNLQKTLRDIDNRLREQGVNPEPNNIQYKSPIIEQNNEISSSDDKNKSLKNNREDPEQGQDFGLG